MDFLFPAGRKLEPGWYAGLAGYDEFAAVRIGLQTEKHPRVMGLPASSGSEAVRRGAAKGGRMAGSDPWRSRFREQRRGRAGAQRMHPLTFRDRRPEPLRPRRPVPV